MILLTDVFSTFQKGYLYGKQGEKVKLISVNDKVLIVEGKNGRFPVPKEKVSN